MWRHQPLEVWPKYCKRETVHIGGFAWDYSPPTNPWHLRSRWECTKSLGPDIRCVEAKITHLEMDPQGTFISGRVAIDFAQIPQNRWPKWHVFGLRFKTNQNLRTLRKTRDGLVLNSPHALPPTDITRPTQLGGRIVALSSAALVRAPTHLKPQPHRADPQRVVQLCAGKMMEHQKKTKKKMRPWPLDRSEPKEKQTTPATGRRLLPTGCVLLKLPC